MRKLIDSISKDDFNHFKAAVEKQTKENEIIKKLYEKLMGHPIPESDLGVAIKIGSNALSAYELANGAKCHPVVISEYLSADNKITTEMNADASDDLIMEAIQHCCTFLIYRKCKDVEPYVIENDYIGVKALKYDVELDNETYYKLRLLVESL